MIECETCEEWFHGGCVGVNKKNFESKDKCFFFFFQKI